MHLSKLGTSTKLFQPSTLWKINLQMDWSMVLKGERRNEKGEIPCGVKSLTCSSLFLLSQSDSNPKGKRIVFMQRMVRSTFSVLISPFSFPQVLLTTTSRLNLLEEVVALVVHEDECGEVFYFNLPDGFHTELGIFYTLDALDVVLCKDCCRTTD